MTSDYGFRTAARCLTDDGHLFQLVLPLVYDCLDGSIVILPTGTTSDGASAPRAVWDVCPPFGKHFMPAYGHDGLYRNKATDANGILLAWPKDKCDEWFREAMEHPAFGISVAHREALYRAVELGGWHAFDEDRAASASDVAAEEDQV